MMQHETGLWILCILFGFLSGSLMFSQMIPRLFLNKNITECSDDHNPGSTNVFLTCGAFWGSICLTLDVLKGAIPVAVGYHLLDYDRLWFALVLAAPVMGHAIAPFNGFHGGKCIATAFGELLALIPITHIVILLAGIYITFSTVLKINPNRVRSIAAFGLFGMLSGLVLMHRNQYSIAIGCILISVIAIFKHSKYFLTGIPAESSPGEPCKEKSVLTESKAEE